MGVQVGLKQSEILIPMATPLPPSWFGLDSSLCWVVSWIFEDQPVPFSESPLEANRSTIHQSLPQGAQWALKWVAKK